MVHNYGCNDPQPAEFAPLPTVFRASGHTTASFGKRHTPGCQHVTNHVWDQGHAICQFADITTYSKLNPRYDDADYRVIHLPGHPMVRHGGPRTPQHRGPATAGVSVKAMESSGPASARTGTAWT